VRGGVGGRGRQEYVAYGRGNMTRNSHKADLIDELYLGVVPVKGGNPGVPERLPQRNFSLVENNSPERMPITKSPSSSSKRRIRELQKSWRPFFFGPSLRFTSALGNS
jgi:hypothetical protein